MSHHSSGSIPHQGPGRPDGARRPLPPIRRVAMLSAHTSPLEQPGNGDAGGMNVYVLELAKRLAARSVEVEIFTRATSSELAPVEPAAPGVSVRHVAAGPFEDLPKQDLPAQLCAFVRDVLRVESSRERGYYDVLHSHYWLSGQVGTVARERWGIPLVHSMHTMAKVKNASLAAGDSAEPGGRVAGEEQVVELADRLIANTADEADQLVGLYGADPARVHVVHPGVDLAVFGPRERLAARARVGLPPGAHVLMFAGRIQPLKAPDVLLRAAADLIARDPSARDDLVVVVVGGPSGSGLERPTALIDLAAELGLADLVRFVPTVTQDQLADWYAAASLVCVPSYNESFGLVALEAQACGTPVVASAVGGLRTAVREGGLLVPGHDPSAYAAAFERVLRDPAGHAAMSRAAVRHAAGFGWDHTAELTVGVYGEAVEQMNPKPRAVAG